MKPVLAVALMTLVGIWFLIKERASRCNSKPEILASAALFMSFGLVIFPGHLLVLYIIVLLEMDTGYSLVWSMLGIPAFALLSLIGVTIFLVKTRARAHRGEAREGEAAVKMASGSTGAAEERSARPGLETAD